MISYCLDPRGKKLGAGWTIAVGLLDFGMRGVTHMDVVKKPLGSKMPAAPLTTMQRVATDHLVADCDNAESILICHAYGAGWTKIGAGAATDTAAGNRGYIRDSLSLVNSQRAGTHHFLADPCADAAMDAAFPFGSWVNSPLAGQITDFWGLGRHLY